MRLAKGHEQPLGKRKIAVNFPDHMFLQIQGMSERQGLPFSRIVTQLCEMALHRIQLSTVLKQKK